MNNRVFILILLSIVLVLLAPHKTMASETSKISKHFIIVYEEKYLPHPTYPQEILDALERSWNCLVAESDLLKFGEVISEEQKCPDEIKKKMKFFKRPPGTEKNKIEVQTTLDLEGGIAGRALPQDKGTATPRLLFSYKVIKDTIFPVAAHEFFHAVQFAYSDPYSEDPWIVESSASWAQAQIFPESQLHISHVSYGYLQFVNSFPLDFYLYANHFQYGSSVFFHYIFSRASEIHGDYKNGKYNIIERIWHYMGENPKPNSLKALALALGSKTLLDEKVKDILLDYALALYLLPHDFSFVPQGKNLKPIEPLSLTDLIKNIDPAGHLISPYHFLKFYDDELNTSEEYMLPLQIQYFSIENWSQFDSIETLNFVVSALNERKWKFAVIYEDKGKPNIEKLDFKNARALYRLKRFGPDAISKLIVVALHIEDRKKSLFSWKNSQAKDFLKIKQEHSKPFYLGYTIGEPPYLEAVKIIRDGKNIYHAQWERVSETSRQKEVLVNEKIDTEGKKPIYLKLSFSRELKTKPKVILGYTHEIKNFERVGSEESLLWQAEIPIAVFEDLARDFKEFPLIVRAQSERGELDLDPNPATIPHLVKLSDSKNEGVWQWQNYADEDEYINEEQAFVKRDKTHNLKLKEKEEVAYRGRVVSKIENKDGSMRKGKPVSGAQIYATIAYLKAPHEKVQERRRVLAKAASKLDMLQEVAKLDLDLLMTEGVRYSGTVDVDEIKTNAQGEFEVPPEKFASFDSNNIYARWIEYIALKDKRMGYVQVVDLGVRVPLKGEKEPEISLSFEKKEITEQCEFSGNFSGSEFIRPVDVRTRYFLLKKPGRVDEEEIIFPHEFATVYGDHEYFVAKPYDIPSYLEDFRKNVWHMNKSFPRQRFIAANPIIEPVPVKDETKYGAIPVKGIITGYRFDPPIKDYVLIQCSFYKSPNSYSAISRTRPFQVNLLKYVENLSKRIMEGVPQP